MLKKRIATALILGFLLALAVFMLPTRWLIAVFAGLGFVGALEWGNLSRARIGGVGRTLVAGAFAVATLSLIIVSPEVVGIPFAVAGSVWWVAQAGCLKFECTLLPYAYGVLISGLLSMFLAVGSMAWIHQIALVGPGLVCVFFITVSAADSGAYFVGRAFGRRRLAPSISPGKTIEGLYGGLASAILAAIIGIATVTLTQCGVGPSSMADWLALVPASAAVGLAAGAASVVGDLTVSRAKRAAGVKDSGSLLPGHGGVLDRIDGVLAAAPVFALGVWILGPASACA